MPILRIPTRRSLAWLAAAAAALAGCSSTENPRSPDAGDADAGPRCEGAPPIRTDCNTCLCNAQGQYACTTIPCPHDLDAGTAVCALDGVYDYGQDGGLVLYVDRVTLSDRATYRLSRTTTGNAPATVLCTLDLPSCGDASRVDVADIDAAVEDPDVQAALARPTPPIYGRDTRPVDGSIFTFHRASGGGFGVGAPCGDDDSDCTPAPAGIQRLVTLLGALDTQEQTLPGCTYAPLPP
jgi:hypothetical protein